MDILPDELILHRVSYLDTDCGVAFLGVTKYIYNLTGYHLIGLSQSVACNTFPKQDRISLPCDGAPHGIIAWLKDPDVRSSLV